MVRIQPDSNLSPSMQMTGALATLPLPTPAGEFTAVYSERGLAELHFPSTRTGKERREPNDACPPAIRAWHRQTTTTLKRFLKTGQTASLPPLDLSGGTDFQRAVWRALRQIPAGKTRTYAQIALAIGRPRAARAVGQACGSNPLPLFIPCHRVVAADGGLGGFSAGPGWKRLLLEREGTAPAV